MKKFIFLLPILLLVNTFTYAQINCGTVTSPQYIQELKDQVANKSACLDSFELYDLNVPITFNLVLSYAKFGNGPKEINQEYLDDVEADINDAFNGQNIYFNFIWNNLDCDECLDHYDNWPDHIMTSSCIQGHLVHEDIPINSPHTGIGSIGKGTFWSKKGSESHELGHALGLLHTSSNAATATGYTNELVTRSNTDENDPCSCNCLVTGDFICDTPPDPRIENPTSQDDSAFNDAMFGNCIMNNDQMVTDSCGDLYTDPNQIVAHNVMSSYCDNENNIPILTAGQNLTIRKKMDNGDGTFMYQLDLSEPNFSQGFTVNTSMHLTTNEAFNSDIIVNSDLTIENCTIELTQGHKIIVNAGANLTISNATVRTYTGSICYFPMGGKANWEGIEINPSASNFTSVSVLAGSTIDVSEAGIYTTNGSFRLLNLAVNNSTVNGPAINISNSFGVQQIKKSHFDSTVMVTDCYYFGVEGCSFDLDPNGQGAGIKAYNTHLVVKAHLDGQRSTFTNGGRGIDFLSSSSHFCKIENTDFTDVLSGIHAESVAGFFDAHDCTISMRDPNGVQGFGDGIFIDNFVDFEIYNNNDISGTGSAFQTGMKLKNVILNDNPNLIINNTIKDCFKGINTSSAFLGNTMSGVEFECNTMINIQNDNFHTNQIGPHQGRGGETSPARAAGNKFDGSTIGFQDFNYEGGGFTDVKTYHYRELGLEIIENFNDGSQVTGIPVFKRNIVEALPNCTYPPAPSDPNPFPQVSTDRTKMLDGGSMDSIMVLISADSDHDPTSVITTILDNSPWTSVPVVQTLFDYSEYYTEQEIADVIIQSPGVLGDDYIYAIAFESSTFSASNQQAMINAYQTGDERID